MKQDVAWKTYGDMQAQIFEITVKMDLTFSFFFKNKDLKQFLL